MSLKLRKSPTLELAAAIGEARREGRTVYSLSTPTFDDRGIDTTGRDGPKTTLSPAAGLDELRNKARAHLFSKWQPSEHDCVICGGAKAAIYCILRVMLSPGDRVLIVSPHWPTYEDTAELAHLDARFLETRADEDFAIDVYRLEAALERSGAKAVVCSNPGNPSGKILSHRELEHLRTKTAAAGAILLIDESFSGIVFDPQKWNDAACAADDHVFVVNSFSKNYHLQGLRLGACLVPPARSEQVIAAHQTVLSAAPTPSQNMALQAIEAASNGLQDYSEQRGLFLEFIAEQNWPHVATEGSFYVFPRIDGIDLFRGQLEAHGILSLPGEAFGAPYKNHVRICFGKPLHEVHALIDTMRDALGSKKGEVA